MFGLDFWGVHSICSVSETSRLVFYLFIFLVAWRIAFMVRWDGTSVAVTGFVTLMRRLGWFVSMGHLECLGLWGGGPLWRSQRLYCLGSVGVGRFVAFTAVEAFGLVPFRGVESVCSVYGTLGRDPCGVYSIGSIYGALGLDVRVAFPVFSLLL